MKLEDQGNTIKRIEKAIKERSEEEKDGLLIPTIATRGELDEFEQQNIEQAVQWTLGRSFKPFQRRRYPNSLP
jgi:hypothetical protein